MKRIYVKYNRERLPRFQTVTTILQEGEQRLVRKEPLTDAAAAHLAEMLTYHRSAQLLPHFRLPDVEPVGRGLQIQYVQGQSLDKVLIDLLSSGRSNSFERMVLEYRQRVEATCQYCEVFRSGPEFGAVFGMDLVLKDVWCQQIPNIDMIFENIIVAGNDYHLIDFEWTFSFPIPAGFILYRNIDNFFSKYRHEISKYTSMERLWSIVGIGDADLVQYKLLEKKFQDYVNGADRPASINVGAQKSVTTLQNLMAQSGSTGKPHPEATEVKEQSASFQERIDQLTVQLAEARNDIQQRWGDIAYRDGQISILKEEARRAEEAADRIGREKQKELSQLELHMRQLEDEISASSELLSALEASIGCHSQELASRDDRVRGLQLELSRIVTIREDLETKLAQKEVEVANRDERLRQIEVELAREHDLIIERFMQKEDELARLDASRAEYEQRIARLTEELETVQQTSAQQLREKEQRIEDLLASLSWKVTAPLRTLYELTVGRGKV